MKMKEKIKKEVLEFIMDRYNAHNPPGFMEIADLVIQKTIEEIFSKPFEKRLIDEVKKEIYEEYDHASCGFIVKKTLEKLKQKFKGVKE